MVEKTHERLSRMQLGIYSELSVLQAQQSNLRSQIADLIGYDKMSHRGYATTDAWKNDISIPPNVKSQIEKLALKRNKLSKLISAKYARAHELHRAVLIAYRKQQRNLSSKRRRK